MSFSIQQLASSDVQLVNAFIAQFENTDDAAALRIPAHHEHPFRSKVNTDSDS
ncbi:MAG: hypothetical protein HOM11_12340 [Methylococcales bacterium]|jgi:hypothetical protein|nr:hypothetical protein [Methylococcales bacterium]MBT7444966.1 hypothetical protein [Methylococcales bacterium]